MARAVPALLALGALLADLSGGHGVAFALLFVAIPGGFALALDCYGRSLRFACAAGGLTLLVLSAALRSPAVVGGVPRLAVSAIVLCLLLYAGAVAAALFSPRPVPATAADRSEQERRLAA